MTSPFPVPPFMAAPEGPRVADVEDTSLDLYQRLADATRRTEEIERRGRTELAEHIRNTRSLIASLAAERFEFERLLRRIVPELQRLQAEDLLRVVSLYARSWDQKLVRLRIEIRDLTGQSLSEGLADEVEVESHVPDPTVTQTKVRETLSPLVLLDGRPIGIAKVVTSVPVPETVAAPVAETGKEQAE